MDVGPVNAVGKLIDLGGEIIRKAFFPTLTKLQALRLLSGIVVLVVVLVGAWVWVATHGQGGPVVTATKDSIAIGGNVSGSTITNGGK